MIIEAGKSYRIFFNEDNINNKKIHVRAIIDDVQIVYKYWSRNRQGWIYQMEHKYYFDNLIRNNYITST